MLDSLRAFARTWIAKILLAVLVVSFGAFGINNVVTGLGSNTVARVGDAEISIRDFQREYEGLLNAAAQQIGRVPTGQEAVALGLPSNAIGRLAANAAIDNLGASLGLGASETRLAEMVRADPSFGGTLGQFSRDQFIAVLRQSGYTEADYLEMQTKAVRRQQLVGALFSEGGVSKTSQDLVNRYSSDKRTVDFFVVNDTAVPPVAVPTEDELKAYLAANQEKYRTEETRQVDVLSLSPAALAASKTFTDAEISAEYERIKANLTKPERRTIRQVVLPDDAAVAVFESGKASGTGFEDLVAQVSLPIVELGTLSQAEVTDSVLATAAFELQAGEFSVIPGVQGKRAIHIAAIQPGGATPLEEAKPEIIKSLGLAAARAELTDVLDQIEELRAAFQPLSEIGKRFNLPVVSVAVTASGAALEANADIPADGRARVAAAIFAASPDTDLVPVVALSGSQNVWFDLKAVEPARDQTLEEVREALVAAWTSEKTEEAVLAKVEELTKALEGGAAVADLAVTVNQFPQLSQAMTRNGDGTPIFDTAVASTIFAGGADHFGSAKNADGDYVIFRVVEVTPAEGEADAPTKAFVENSVRDSLYGQFVTGLRDDAGLLINQGVLNQIRALDPAGN